MSYSNIHDFILNNIFYLIIKNNNWRGNVIILDIILTTTAILDNSISYRILVSSISVTNLVTIRKCGVM